MARRARRQNPREKAKIQKAVQQIKEKANRSISRGLQEFAIQVMNDLAQRGPAWSGEFSASWRFVPAGQSGGGPGPEGDVYRYGKKDLRITTIEKYINAKVQEFQIVNTSRHASAAIDQDVRTFIRPEDPPVDTDRVQAGDKRDNPSLRYDIGNLYASGTPLSQAEASRTADPDWYYTYLKGGDLQIALDRNMDRGFRTEFFR